jgi:hypothetical protein
VDVVVTAGINASLDYPLQIVVPPVATSGTMSPPIAPSVRIRAPLEMKKARSNPEGNWDRVDTMRD